MPGLPAAEPVHIPSRQAGEIARSNPTEWPPSGGSARTMLAAWANALAAGSRRAATAALETRLRLRPALVASDRKNAASASRQA